MILLIKFIVDIYQGEFNLTFRILKALIRDELNNYLLRLAFTEVFPEGFFPDRILGQRLSVEQLTYAINKYQNLNLDMSMGLFSDNNDDATENTPTEGDGMEVNKDSNVNPLTSDTSDGKSTPLSNSDKDRKDTPLNKDDKGQNVGMKNINKLSEDKENVNRKAQDPFFKNMPIADNFDPFRLKDRVLDFPKLKLQETYGKFRNEKVYDNVLSGISILKTLRLEDFCLGTEVKFTNFKDYNIYPGFIQKGISDFNLFFGMSQYNVDKRLTNSVNLMKSILTKLHFNKNYVLNHELYEKMHGFVVNALNAKGLRVIFNTLFTKNVGLIIYGRLGFNVLVNFLNTSYDSKEIIIRKSAGDSDITISRNQVVDGDLNPVDKSQLNNQFFINVYNEDYNLVSNEDMGDFLHLDNNLLVELGRSIDIISKRFSMQKREPMTEMYKFYSEGAIKEYSKTEPDGITLKSHAYRGVNSNIKCYNNDFIENEGNTILLLMITRIFDETDINDYEKELILFQLLHVLLRPYMVKISADGETVSFELKYRVISQRVDRSKLGQLYYPTHFMNVDWRNSGNISVVDLARTISLMFEDRINELKFHENSLNLDGKNFIKTLRSGEAAFQVDQMTASRISIKPKVFSILTKNMNDEEIIMYGLCIIMFGPDRCRGGTPTDMMDESANCMHGNDLLKWGDLFFHINPDSTKDYFDIMYDSNLEDSLQKFFNLNIRGKGFEVENMPIFTRGLIINNNYEDRLEDHALIRIGDDYFDYTSILDELLSIGMINQKYRYNILKKRYDETEFMHRYKKFMKTGGDLTVGGNMDEYNIDPRMHIV